MSPLLAGSIAVDAPPLSPYFPQCFPTLPMIYANRKHPTPINTLKQKFILKYSVFQKGAIIVPSISMSISQSFFGKFTAKSKD